MKILVTGGTGLVGSRLLKHLVASGIDCRATVRAGKTLPEGVTPIEADLADASALESAVEGVSAIIHLAAVLRTPVPKDIWTANVAGTRNLIAATQSVAPDARFIMASTGLVYNADSEYPALESDPVEPTMDYPASKVAAEKELQESGLNWSIQRFGFVYGDEDGHIDMIPKLAGMFKWHPANRLSMIHHRDIATSMELALTGALDGRIVNVVDDAPMTIYELCQIAGVPLAASATPLQSPWHGVIDGGLARSLGFRPKVRTTYQASDEGSL